MIGGLLHRHLMPVAFVEQFHNPRRGNSGHFVKKRLGEIHAMLPQRFHPSLVMQRHRVGDGPITIED